MSICNEDNDMRYKNIKDINQEILQIKSEIDKLSQVVFDFMKSGENEKKLTNI